MKTRGKALRVLLCAMLLIVVSVCGTLAYLTDQHSVTNTFTVGKVYIKLDEANLNENATPSRTEEGNEYHLLPGHKYVKDPTVTVLEGTENAYIRMIVKVSNYTELKAAFPTAKYPTWYSDNDFLLQYLVEGWDPDTWISTKKVVVDSETDVATYEFRYRNSAFGPAENNDGKVDGTPLPALFKKIVVPGTVNNTELANLQNVTIDVEAHAIQAAGFDDADAAWTAFDE